MHMYEDGLQRCNANYTPLTPVDFLVRASEVYGDKTAVLYVQAKRTWRQKFERCVPLASALAQLDAQAIHHMLEHGEARVLVIDAEYATLAQAVAEALPDLKIIKVHDTSAVADDSVLATVQSYDNLIGQGSPNFQNLFPADEWDATALNYASGTTGYSKDVVSPHRGANLTPTPYRMRAPRKSLFSAVRSRHRSRLPRRRTSVNCPRP
ncbi:AMP-binding protein [Paraburkholderia sp. HP33-1]|uniref:AMP-binding protein n=1 Tax=Paraburkholderia sp. HP33-1 TaxID=2883243 RepID=UPI001F28F763|nr:AMP-binding protein [Paraburkholderia sp. HP33-1]